MKRHLPEPAEYYRPTRARALREKAARLDRWLGGASPEIRKARGTVLGLVSLPPLLAVAALIEPLVPSDAVVPLMVIGLEVAVLLVPDAFRFERSGSEKL